MKTGEAGIALVLALMLMALLSALAVALLLATASETLVTAAYGRGSGALAAADAGAQRVVNDLLVVSDWNRVLDGTVQSSFADGAPTGERVLVDGRTLDLAQVRNQANCSKSTQCSAADLAAVTASRPWGANNPVWQLYGYGRARDFGLPGTLDSPYYVVVLVGDDSAENDGDPQHDGATVSNPGAGILALRAEAFGPSGVHRVVEVSVARVDTTLLERGYTAQRGQHEQNRASRASPVQTPGGTLSFESVAIVPGGGL